MIKLIGGRHRLREFQYEKIYQSLLTPEIVALLMQIREYKGEQTLFIESKRDTLTQLADIAKIQSTEASNRIEGIYTSDDRLKKIVRDKTMPRSRNEKEIAGYRDVLATIHESHDFIPPTVPMFLQLHRDLYKYSGKSIGGTYKTQITSLKRWMLKATRLFGLYRFLPGRLRKRWIRSVLHSLRSVNQRSTILYS